MNLTVLVDDSRVQGPLPGSRDWLTRNLEVLLPDALTTAYTVLRGEVPCAFPAMSPGPAHVDDVLVALGSLLQFPVYEAVLASLAENGGAALVY